MKNSVLFVGLLFSLFTSILGFAQGVEKDGYYIVCDTIKGKPVTHIYESKKVYDYITQKKKKNLEALKYKKAEFTRKEKQLLAERIEEINAKVGFRANYTEEQLQTEKEATAASTADKITKYNAIIDAQIDFESVNTQLSNGEGANVIASLEDGVTIKIKNNVDLRKEIFTTSEFTFSIGYNFMDGESLGIDDFSYGDKNNYFSMGYYWKTRLDKNNHFRVSYGFDYQSQGTELNGGRVFSVNTENTQIVDLGRSVDKAKFRQDQLVFPVHFEVGGSKRKDYEDGRVRFEDKGFQMGIGGFAGFNLSSRLKLKFEEDGSDIKQNFVNAFDTEPFVYGLDAYAGWPGIKFFGRMNLNDVFKAGSVDAQYVTFGIRIR